MKKRVLGVVLIAIAGCASIPFGTMWQMAGFDADDLRTLNPAEIHAAVLVPDNIKIQQVQLYLDLGFEEKTAPAKHFEYTLIVKKEGQFVPVPLPVAEEGWHWYYADLPPEAETQFTRVQKHYKELREKYSSFAFGANVKFDRAQADTFNFSLWLQLKESRGWFALFEEVPVTLKKSDTQNANAN